VPFFHVGGLSSLWATWCAGGNLILPAQPKFEPSSVLTSCSSADGAGWTTNALVVVPAMLYAVKLEVEKKNGRDLPCCPAVGLVLIGGQSASPDVLRFVAKVFPNARVVQTYACTEAASSLTFQEVSAEIVSNDDSSSHHGLSGDCVGSPPAHVELCLFTKKESDDTVRQSTLVPVEGVYQVGIIGTRGPHVMNGYWVRGGSTEGSSRALKNEGGWFWTNDLGYWDEQGRLYFSGRVTDSIRTGGETVMASEVERVVSQHPDCQECAVFGLPDEKYGETVCCAIVCRRQSSTDLAKIRQWCQQEGLAGYKRPRRVFQVQALPRNTSGKVLKFRLKERFGMQLTKQWSKL
jgi:fatty-acyl-CoA synthase